jgi:hypothetical protein
MRDGMTFLGATQSENKLQQLGGAAVRSAFLSELTTTTSKLSHLAIHNMIFGLFFHFLFLVLSSFAVFVFPGPIHILH